MPVNAFFVKIEVYDFLRKPLFDKADEMFISGPTWMRCVSTDRCLQQIKARCIYQQQGCIFRPGGGGG